MASPLSSSTRLPEPGWALEVGREEGDGPGRQHEGLGPHRCPERHRAPHGRATPASPTMSHHPPTSMPEHPARSRRTPGSQGNDPTSSRMFLRGRPVHSSPIGRGCPCERSENMELAQRGRFALWFRRWLSGSAPSLWRRRRVTRGGGPDGDGPVHCERRRHGDGGERPAHEPVGSVLVWGGSVEGAGRLCTSSAATPTASSVAQPGRPWGTTLLQALQVWPAAQGRRATS